MSGEREVYPESVFVHQVAVHVVDDVDVLTGLHDSYLGDQQLGILIVDLHLLDRHLCACLQVRCREHFASSSAKL